MAGRNSELKEELPERKDSRKSELAPWLEDPAVYPTSSSVKQESIVEFKENTEIVHHLYPQHGDRGGPQGLVKRESVVPVSLVHEESCPQSSETSVIGVVIKEEANHAQREYSGPARYAVTCPDNKVTDSVDILKTEGGTIKVESATSDPRESQSVADSVPSNISVNRFPVPVTLYQRQTSSNQNQRSGRTGGMDGGDLDRTPKNLGCGPVMPTNTGSEVSWSCNVQHTGSQKSEKPIRCLSCDYKCAKNAYLISHMRKHTGEKPYKCPLCDFTCAQKFPLTRHMRVHTGEKPYECPMCGYRCAQKSHLQAHRRTHTGEKPYQCSLCEHSCGRQSHLIRHMMAHTGEKPHQCSLCDYKSARKTRLIAHMRKHTGEKPYVCSLCDYRSVQKTNLRMHMRKHIGKQS